MEAAHGAGVLPAILGLPEGWGTHMGRSGTSLSGGELARLSFARLLLSAAPVFVLDEPEAHHD